MKKDKETSTNAMDPDTAASLQQGKDAIKIQQDQNPAPDEKKKTDEKKDAEKWRNEG
jgi:hypothetical protein